MLNLLKTILGLFGPAQGASVVNAAGGVINHAALAVVVTWTLTEPEAVVTITASRMAILLGAAVIWAVLEAMRRSRPRNPNERD